MSTREPNSATKSVLIVAIAGIIWGTLAPSSRYLASSGADMTTVAAGRAFFAFTGSLIYLLFTNPRALMITKNQIPVLLITGLSCYFIYAGMSLSVVYIPVPLAIVIISTYPLMTAVGSSFINGEPPSSAVLAGGILCLIGVFSVTGLDSIATYGRENLITGGLWAIAAGAGTASYSVAGRYAIKSGKIAQSTLYVYSQGTGLALILFISGKNLSFAFTSSQLILILYVGAVATLFGYSLYFIGLKGLSASSASVIAMIEPVTALMLSSFILREPPSPRELTGAAAILMAVLLAAWDGLRKYRGANSKLARESR